MDESTLIHRLKHRDQSAFAHLLKINQERVFTIVFGFLKNQDDAEDATQEVFIEVFQSIGSFKEKSKLSTWIYRIAVQKSLEVIRRNNRKKRSAVLISLFGLEDHVPSHSNTPFYHPGVKLENKERSAILFDAIAKLPENQKVAFTLHKVDQFSYDEIAEIMKLTLPSVESLMFRAKQNLKKELSDYYDKNEK